MTTTNNLKNIARMMLVMLVAVVTLVLTGCSEEPQLSTQTKVNGEGKEPTPAEPTLSNVTVAENVFVKTISVTADSEDDEIVLTGKYLYKVKFVLAYSSDTKEEKKEQVEEYIISQTARISGLHGVFTVDNIDEIANKKFDVNNDGKAEIAGREVSVTTSKTTSKEEYSFSNGKTTYRFGINLKEGSTTNGQSMEVTSPLLSNEVYAQNFSFAAAEKVEGTDNTYNLTGNFTAEVKEDGDDLVYTFPAVATTSEKDEVYYTIENVRLEGNKILFDGVEGHTLHPELNKTEAQEKIFDASLRAGEPIRYNDLNSVSEANQNGNVFSYIQGAVTLVATYPNEVTIEYNGVNQVVSIPAPAFAEVNRNENKSEDDDYNYVTTDITYEMSWNNVVAASAKQTFIGQKAKEKDAVSRIYLDYTEVNGEINGKLIEEHTIADDKVLLTFSGNREFSVKAENTITIEAAENKLSRTGHKNGSWEKAGDYVGNNIKGDKMTATFVHTYNGNVNNSVVVSMNRNLYVEYAGVRYEIADPSTTLTGNTPVAGTTSDDNIFYLYNYTVTYTATAADMKATATQAFVVKVRKPEPTFPGWEVDEAYRQHFATTLSWNSATSAYETFNGIVFRNINDHNQKKMVVFKNGTKEVFVQQDAVKSEVDAFFAKCGSEGFLSTNYSEAGKGKVAALLGVHSLTSKDQYMDGFTYLPFDGSSKRSFTKEHILTSKLPNPYRGTITKGANGLWGGLYF